MGFAAVIKQCAGEKPSLIHLVASDRLAPAVTFCCGAEFLVFPSSIPFTYASIPCHAVILCHDLQLSLSRASAFLVTILHASSLATFVTHFSFPYHAIKQPLSRTPVFLVTHCYNLCHALRFSFTHCYNLCHALRFSLPRIPTTFVTHSSFLCLALLHPLSRCSYPCHAPRSFVTCSYNLCHALHHLLLRTLAY